MRNTDYKQIEELFIHYLEGEAVKINARFDYVTCRAYAKASSRGPGEGMHYLGMYMDCLLTDAAAKKADNVALVIQISDLDGKWNINADICWGHPSGKIDAELFAEPVEVTDESLSIVKEKLPELVSKLHELIRDNPKGI